MILILLMSSCALPIYGDINDVPLECSFYAYNAATLVMDKCEGQHVPGMFKDIMGNVQDTCASYVAASDDPDLTLYVLHYLCIDGYDHALQEQVDAMECGDFLASGRGVAYPVEDLCPCLDTVRGDADTSTWTCVNVN